MRGGVGDAPVVRMFQMKPAPLAILLMQLTCYTRGLAAGPQLPRRVEYRAEPPETQPAEFGPLGAELLDEKLDQHGRDVVRTSAVIGESYKFLAGGLRAGRIDNRFENLLGSHLRMQAI